MKVYSRKTVMNILKQFGFKKTAGNGSGHDVWRNAKYVCHPVAFKRQSDISINWLYCMGLELENQGFCKRTDFILAVKTGLDIVRIN
jgi:predicted RNA binding protein YcfA (HicA-like mRNA interferase family)